MTVQGVGGWRRWGYALCNVGTAVGQVPTTLLLLYYLTQVAGLRASLAGLVVALPKLWDALVDPMFGGWVDRLALRLGRRAPVAVASGIGFLATLVLTFSLPALRSSTEIMVMVTLLQIVSSTSQTALGVTQFALATEMADEPVGLSRLLSLSAVAAQVMSVVFSIVAPLLVAWSGGGAAGYSRMTAEVAAVAGLALAGFVLATRDVPVRRSSAESDAMPTWTALRATSANRSFYCLIAFVLCVNAGASMLFGFLPFANQYVLGGQPGSLSVLEGVLGVTVLLGMLLAPQFARRMAPLAAMRRCNLAVAAGLGLLFAASFAPAWSTWAALAGVGLASGVIGVLVQTATLAATRLELRHSVVVSMGFYLGIMLAGMKIGNSLGGFAAGQLLDAVGFVPGGAAQAAQTVAWLRCGDSLVPLLFTLLGAAFLHRVRLPEARPASAPFVAGAVEQPAG